MRSTCSAQARWPSPRPRSALQSSICLPTTSFRATRRTSTARPTVPTRKTSTAAPSLAGRSRSLQANPRHVIVRTAWVYSPFGRNFVKTMLGLAERRDSVRVVSDQWGNPTSAADIADGILRIAGMIGEAAPADRYGVFHMAGQGGTSWSGLARHVYAESRQRGGPFAEVEEIASEDYPTRARRPRNSLLSCEKLWNIYGWRAPDWRISCSAVVQRLV